MANPTSRCAYATGIPPNVTARTPIFRIPLLAAFVAGLLAASVRGGYRVGACSIRMFWSAETSAGSGSSPAGYPFRLRK